MPIQTEATVRATLLRLSLSLVIASGGGAAAASTPGRAERARYLMGTVCEATAYAETAGAAGAAIDAAFDEIARLESVLSDYRQDSELSRMNRQAAAGPFACGPDLYGFLSAAADLSRRTGGAFDPTVAPLVQAWDLRGEGRIPTLRQIGAALALVGASRLELDPGLRTVRFGVQGMALDPGGLGKGYALDAAGRVLRQRGVTAALIDFGGQVLAIGEDPSARDAVHGGGGWLVAIAHPARRDEAAMTISLRDASASTSGNSERGVRRGGRLLGHIVDPRTGRPTSYEGSVTVISQSATEADAFSTALIVMGVGRGLRWADEQRDLRAVYLQPGPAGNLRVLPSAAFAAFLGNNPVRMVRTGNDNHGGIR